MVLSCCINHPHVVGLFFGFTTSHGSRDPPIPANPQFHGPNISPTMPGITFRSIPVVMRWLSCNVVPMVFQSRSSFFADRCLTGGWCAITILKNDGVRQWDGLSIHIMENTIWLFNIAMV